MRYEIHVGKFGCYFYDTEEDKDVTLKEALDIMNKNNTQTKKRLVEQCISEEDGKHWPTEKEEEK